jgi:hypothetical protein
LDTATDKEDRKLWSKHKLGTLFLPRIFSFPIRKNKKPVKP